MNRRHNPQWIRLCFWFGVGVLVVYALLMLAGVCPCQP